MEKKIYRLFSGQQSKINLPAQRSLGISASSSLSLRISKSSITRLITPLLLILLTVSLTGCAWFCSWCEVREEPSGLNRNPVVKSLYAERDGQRMRLIEPNSTVTLRAHAVDADHDTLRYKWVTTPGSGNVNNDSGPTAEWTVGSGQGYHTVKLMVLDGRRGVARSALRLSTGPRPVFSGRILSVTGEPIAEVQVEVNGQAALADDQGRFALELENANAGRFLFNARKPGYGLVSRVYDDIIRNGSWVMTRATTQTINPSQTVLVRDLISQQECQGPQSARINWHLYPRQRSPQLAGSGGATSSGAFPAQLREAVEFIFSGTECSPGVSLQIPANSLVNAQGNPPTGSVDISLSTVDIFAPDALPGDLTVLTDECLGMMRKRGMTTAAAGYYPGYPADPIPDCTRVMQSYGAGTVAASAGDEAYQLKPGANAVLTIPVDPAQLKGKAEIPPSIPLLLYDANMAAWVKVGSAALNAGKDAYVGTVSHFSEYNMDLIKTDQSCVRVDASALPASFSLDVVVPMGGAAPVVKNKPISEDPTEVEPRLHAIYNLPSDTWIALIPMHDVGGTLVPYGIFGVNTGAPQVPTDPNRPTYPYNACQAEVALSDVGGLVAFEVDGTADHSAELPLHTYALVDAGGTDIYPVGAGAYPELYMFAPFDTGSNIVLINNTDAGTLNMGASSPTNPNQDVDVRISGLNGVDPVTLAGTIYAPGDPGGAQAEVAGIRVGIRTTTIPSLIGTPVASQVVALIDNTTLLSRGPYAFCGGCYFEGPDITFFAPGDPAAPIPQHVIELERFGTAGTAITDLATQGQRYVMRNVAFRHGTNIIDDDDSVADPRHFSFDTASRATIISTDMATNLGIDLTVSGVEDCWTDGAHSETEMYKVDSITMSNPDGSFYKVNNASVCVDLHDDKIITYYAAGNKVDAVIGMNLFLQAPVIFDGPANTLGVGIAAP